MNFTNIKIVPIIVLSMQIIGCQYLTNKYKSLDNEFLRYVGRGKVGVAYDVRVHNDFAYVANNQGVVIFDVSAPENLRKVGNIDIGGASFGIDVEEESIYITGGNNLFIADITQPQNPEMLGAIDLSGNLSQVKVEGQYAYVANRQKGLQVVDVSDPNNLEIVGDFQNGGTGEAVEVVGNIVYFGDSNDGLEIIDATNPATLRLLKTVPEAERAWDIAIDTTKEYIDIYIGCHGNGLCIVRQSRDGEFSVLSQFNDGGEAQGVWFENHTLFVADNFEFDILDVREPRRPKILEKIKNLNGLHDLFVDGTHVYLADGPGLFILEYKEH